MADTARLLVDPAALGCAGAEEAARRATATIEGRLNRRLIVRRHPLRVRSACDWARQWPVVLACEPVPGETGPAPLALAAYPVETGEADDSGERLDLGSYPDRGFVSVYAGYRRADQDRDALNAALAVADPGWGSAPLSAEAFARVPELPGEIAQAALGLARGYLDETATGLGAIDARREERGERVAQVKRRSGWEEELLAPLDRFAWVDA